MARTFAAMPDTSRGWLTNKNWVIATPMEVGIAPRERAIPAARPDPPPEQRRLRTLSIGRGAPADDDDRDRGPGRGGSNYGRIAEALWYMDRIVETFDRVTPGSISEMMPDFGCFTIAWTSYGIVVPLIQHVFGIEPDAVRKTVRFAPHVPEGWNQLSIDDLPVGTNLVSFAGARTPKGMEYTIESRDSGWTFELQAEGSSRCQILPQRPAGLPGAGGHSDDREQEPGPGRPVRGGPARV